MSLNGKLRLVFPHHINTQRHLCAPFNRAPPCRNYPALSCATVCSLTCTHNSYVQRLLHSSPRSSLPFLFISMLSSISYVCVLRQERLEWNGIKPRRGPSIQIVCAHINDIFFYSCLVCVCEGLGKVLERTISQHNSISRTASSRRFSRFFK